MPSYTSQIADFASSIRLKDVPEAVIMRAKGLMLDGLGCGLYAADVKWTQILMRVIERMEPNGGPASIWGRSESASVASAALVNGTMVQGYELDDVHPRAAMHSGAAVLPAAIAAAEYAGAEKVDGAKLLMGIIAGFEIGPRIGMCMGRENMLNNGWHSGAIVAPFSAAITAGIVLGLDKEQFVHALGIAGTQASGLMAAQYGSMVKRMHVGRAAQSGLYGATLAAEGFTGIEDVFEEKYGGYCSTFSHRDDQFDLSALTEGLGTEWETLRYDIKTYACRGGNHTSVNAIDELINETGFKADDVDEITIGVTAAMVQKGGWPYAPKGLTGAQMHTGYCVAMRIIEGDVFVDQMVEENVMRPDLVALTNRIRLVRNEERERKGRDYWNGADVEVRLKNRTVLKRTVDFPVGSEHRPLTAEQMATKFRRLAGKTLPQEQVSRMEKAIWGLDREASVKPLIAALRGISRN